MTDGEPDVSIHLDTEVDLDPAEAFREIAISQENCPHPPDAVEAIGDDFPERWICSECGHELDGWELEERGFLQ